MAMPSARALRDSLCSVLRTKSLRSLSHIGPIVVRPKRFVIRRLRLNYFLTRLWTLTKFSEPAGLLNSVGRFFPWGSKQTFSVSPSIS
jgi:hypothetical protein